MWSHALWRKMFYAEDTLNKKKKKKVGESHI